uniref:Transmembrane protein n=1 Tax=Heterorhabditis bacteriophora TaxID=37862 RepID=A0A1I7WEH8_HETBA
MMAKARIPSTTVVEQLIVGPSGSSDTLRRPLSCNRNYMKSTRPVRLFFMQISIVTLKKNKKISYFQDYEANLKTDFLPVAPSFLCVVPRVARSCYPIYWFVSVFLSLLVTYVHILDVLVFFFTIFILFP